MTALTDLTIAEARDRLRKGDFTARELTEAHIEAIEAAGALNAFCTKTPERAMSMAEEADKKLAGDRAALPGMCGIPVAVKDLFCTKGVRTQAASKILSGFTPSYESTVTSHLWADGAVMLGKVSMDEFAMGSSNETACYGNVVSPWRAEGSDAPLTPGGSSGGSATAVAARLAPAALGTDTGGSIRQPAALTGIVGLKPTYGRVSRWGIVAFASSLDQAGAMARCVRDTAIVLQSIAKHDARDSTSRKIDTPDYEAALTGDIRGKRIGIPEEYMVDGMSETAMQLWQDGADKLADMGAEIIPVSLPHTKYALPAYYIIAPAEASSNLARYDGVRYGHRAGLAESDGITEMYEKSRAEGFGPEVRRRVMIGTYVLSAGYYDAYYAQAQKVRALIKQDFEAAFAQVDALLTPATPSAAFELGSKNDDPLEMYLQDVFTVTLNLAGLPGISIPAGLNRQGLPLGLQLVGKPFGEAELLNVAHALEGAMGFAAKPEQWWT